MLRYKNTLIEILVTCFFVGRIKFAPGTFGSLLAFPLSYFLIDTSMKNELFLTHALIRAFVVMSIAIVFLFFIGWICSAIYVKTTGRQDPKEVVIDEVVGQMIVIILGSAGTAFLLESGMKEFMAPRMMDFLFLFLMPFILFRLFDIFKPWPINWIDKNIKGGLGVMLDDVLAGIFAVVMQYFLIFIAIDWLIPKIS